MIPRSILRQRMYLQVAEFFAVPPSTQEHALDLGASILFDTTPAQFRQVLVALAVLGNGEPITPDRRHLAAALRVSIESLHQGPRAFMPLEPANRGEDPS